MAWIQIRWRIILCNSNLLYDVNRDFWTFGSKTAVWVYCSATITFFYMRLATESSFEIFTPYVVVVQQISFLLLTSTFYYFNHFFTYSTCSCRYIEAIMDLFYELKYIDYRCCNTYVSPTLPCGTSDLTVLIQEFDLNLNIEITN